MFAYIPKNKDGSFTITGDIFEHFGLFPGYDCGDVQYAMKIANNLGYKCRTGLALHLFPKKKNGTHNE